MAEKLSNIRSDADSSHEINPTATRFLTPDMARIHLGNRGALHVTVMNDRIYGGVYAVYMFPVRHPDQWISLRHINSKEVDLEVGIVRDLAEWPPEQRDLLQEALTRYYFIHTITSVKHIGWKFGFMYLEVDTDKGPVNFMMRYQVDRAVDYGRRGKILMDVDENRYLIPDLDAMDPSERQEFQRYIYW